MAHWGRPPLPAGGVEITIESDECCSSEPVAGRNFNTAVAKPSYFTKSESDWQTFLSEVARLVKTYKREGIGFFLLPVAIICFLLFHPAFGPLAQSMEDNQMGLGAGMPIMLFGIFGFIGIQMWGRKQNVLVDQRIEELCRSTSADSGAKIELVTT